MSEKIIRKTFHFRGAVQGVGFRYRAVMAAREAGVSGWVRNEYDGSVRMEIQGTQTQIDYVLQTIKRSPHIVIRGTRTTEIPVRDDEREFYIKDDIWY